MNKTQKLNYIVDEINSVKNYSKHTKDAKELKITFYKGNIDKLTNVPKETILKHSFGSEVLRLSESLEKKQIINKIIKGKKVVIERHKYAPEMNKAYINNYEIKAPQITDFEQLKNFLTKYSLNNLKNMLLFN